jgi:hypothetical protein
MINNCHSMIPPLADVLTGFRSKKDYNSASIGENGILGLC